MEDKRELLNLIQMALEEWLGSTRVAISPKWQGGKIIIQPGNPAMQSKEIEINGLLHKVVMIRDSLRVLEQKINQNDKLEDIDKVQLQQYITRIYGTLTTFNLLFRDEDDKFVGQRT